VKVHEEQFMKESIIATTNEEKNLIKSWFDKINIRTELLFRGSVDGFRNSAFHAKCDDKGHTLSIIKTEYGEVFGGYAHINWTGYGDWKRDADAWIF